MPRVKTLNHLEATVFPLCCADLSTCRRLLARQTALAICAQIFAVPLPSATIPPKAATAMSEAMSAYSMAAAPALSDGKLCKIVRTAVTRHSCGRENTGIS